jgi:archaellum component FlaC
MMTETAQPSEINTAALPRIKGSTVDILRFLYQTQIDMKNASPSDKMIMLDAWAASSRQQMPQLDTLMEMRENIDKGIANFNADNFKAFGATYKQRNSELSTAIGTLDQTYSQLVSEYEEIKSLQEKARTSYRTNSQGPSEEQMNQLTTATNKFIKSTRDYTANYSNIRLELATLGDAVLKFVPSGSGREGPTPTLGGS